MTLHTYKRVWWKAGIVYSCVLYVMLELLEQSQYITLIFYLNVRLVRTKYYSRQLKMQVIVCF